MVTASQNLRHLKPFKINRTSVLGIFQKACAEGVLLGADELAKDARNKASNCIHHNQGRHLATSEHIIANRKLFIHPVKNALIKALVMAADEDKVLSAVCIFFYNALLKRASTRAHCNYTCIGQLLLSLADSRHHRLRLEHHAGTAAKGSVVHSAMHIMRKFTRIDAANFN